MLTDINNRIAGAKRRKHPHYCRGERTSLSTFKNVTGGEMSNCPFKEKRYEGRKRKGSRESTYFLLDQKIAERTNSEGVRIHMKPGRETELFH